MAGTKKQKALAWWDTGKGGRHETVGVVMSLEILADRWPSCEQTPTQTRMLAEYFMRMPPTAVDTALGWQKGTCARAIRRGEMRFIKLPEGKRVQVTPRFVAEWIERYCVQVGHEIENSPIHA